MDPLNMPLMPPSPTEGFVEPTFKYEPGKVRIFPDIPITPKGDRVIVIQSKFIQRSVIYVPETAQQKPTTGKVVAIGPEVPEDFVKLGELIIFGQYSGVPIAIVDGSGEVNHYLFLHPSEIMGELNVEVDKVKEPEIV